MRLLNYLYNSKREQDNGNQGLFSKNNVSHSYKGARDDEKGHGNYSSGNIFTSQFSIAVDILPKINFSLKRPHSLTIITKKNLEGFHMG